MGVIDYFRILKAFTILFLFIFFLNVLNQGGKLLEEMLAGSNADALKITLKGLRYL